MPDVKFSHIGIIVKNIQKFGQILETLLCAEPISEVVEDPNQKAFLQMYRSGETFLELIAPASEDSSVQTALKRHGEGLAHLCFETNDLEQTLKNIRKQGVLVFRSPTPAALFAGKKVAFAILPNQMIVEFVEANWQNSMNNISKLR